MNPRLIQIAFLGICALLLLGAAACSDSVSNEPAQTEQVQQEFDAWTLSRPPGYTFNYDETGFTPLPGVWQIAVEGETVVAVTQVDGPATDHPLTVEGAPTIESLFETVLQELLSPDVTVTFLLNTEFHYPAEAYFDAGSEGWGFRVVAYSPQ